MEPASGEMQYFTNDGNFNTTALIDANSGAVVERYQYDPYGKVTVLNGASGAEKDPNVTEWTPDADNKSDWDNDVLFCGYQYDPVTGLYQVRNRYYDPVTGTWKTRDKILYPDGMNLYEYCLGNSTIYRDPTGLSASDDIRLIEGWIEVRPEVDEKTKFMSKQLKRRSVERYTRNSWIWNYDGGDDYIWIDCDYNGLTEAVAWYEDGIREWLHHNVDEFRKIIRAYATEVRDSGGNTVTVLAKTYDFAHKWTKWASSDPSGDMLWGGIGRHIMWALADRTVSSGHTDAKVNTTNHGGMSKYFYDMTNRKVNSDDQTHHFAGYFAAGETGHLNAVHAGLWLTNDTPKSNPGDYLLGVVAGELGRSYDAKSRYLGEEIQSILTATPSKRSGDDGWNDAIDNASELLGMPGSLPSRVGVIGPWIIDSPLK
jgi:RHS repeat-associated protein